MKKLWKIKACAVCGAQLLEEDQCKDRSHRFLGTLAIYVKAHPIDKQPDYKTKLFLHDHPDLM